MSLLRVFASKPAPRIAVCFFGITRSLGHTVRSIETNVLAPARLTGTVTVHGHFFREARIENARSGEYGVLDPEEYRLLSYDTLTLDEPDTWIDPDWAERLKENGDYWKDGFRSFRNYLHQLESLRQVTEAALETGPDIVAFCRPDLLYHDSLEPGFRRAAASRRSLALIPPWQHWQGGLNDRFAICAGTDSIRAYGCRIHVAETFVRRTGLPLHSEQMVRFALFDAGIRVRDLDVSASRIRLGGARHEEDFEVRKKGRLKERRRLMKMFRSGRAQSR